MQLSAGKLWGLRRLADESGRFKMTAVDQRPPIKNPIREIRGTAEAPWEDVAGVKKLLVETLQEESTAMLLDPHFAYPHAVSVFSPQKGLIVTLEDSVFEETAGGRLSKEIDDWSVEKIKRVGADAVKVLTWYRPDASPAVNQAQRDFTQRIGEACARYDIPYVFELLVYPLADDDEQTTDYVEMRTKKPDLVLQSVETFAHPDFGVDVFKLESPLAADDVPGVGHADAKTAQTYFDALAEAAGRPWVMLSAGADMAAFERVLTHAYAAGASGYLAGRAIWLKAFGHFPDWDAMRSDLAGEGVSYMRRINGLTDAHAQPWFSHPVFGDERDGARLVPATAEFRHSYKGFGG